MDTYSPFKKKSASAYVEDVVESAHFYSPFFSRYIHSQSLLKNEFRRTYVITKMQIAITLYDGLFNHTPQGVMALDWDALCHKLSTFTVMEDKFRAPGFGAHILAGFRRSAANVTAVTAFIFDVDAGTPQSVSSCFYLIRRSGISFHAYSSHSHTIEKPALRLIIPSTRDISPGEYSRLRLHLIKTFNIPCVPTQSADVSRFWFLPSHPPGAVPFTESFTGQPFNPDTLPLSVRYGRVVSASARKSVPSEVAVSPDLLEVQAILSARAASLRRSKDQRKQENGNALARLLGGLGVAEHGSRNEMMARVCGVMVYATPRGTPISSLLEISRPSLEAMQADGSKLTATKVDAMLSSAQRKREQEETAIAEWAEKKRRRTAAFLASMGLEDPSAE